MTRRHRERYEVAGTARFLTFSCYRRLRLFDNDRIKAEFVARSEAACDELAVDVFAWVVMPEHVHLVVMAREPGATMAAFLRRLKGPFAQHVVRRWVDLDAPILSRVRTSEGYRFWQRGGGHDRNVVGNELLEKIRYCHANPVARGLAATSVAWPWSSAQRYEGQPDALGPPIAFDRLPRDGGLLT